MDLSRVIRLAKPHLKNEARLLASAREQQLAADCEALAVGKLLVEEVLKGSRAPRGDTAISKFAKEVGWKSRQTAYNYIALYRAAGTTDTLRKYRLPRSYWILLDGFDARDLFGLGVRQRLLDHPVLRDDHEPDVDALRTLLAVFKAIRRRLTGNQWNHTLPLGFKEGMETECTLYVRDDLEYNEEGIKEFFQGAFEYVNAEADFDDVVSAVTKHQFHRTLKFNKREIHPTRRAMPIRDRIKALRRVQAKMLKPHPEAWRVHPDSQIAAMSALLKEVGFASALLVIEQADDSLMLVDGHLRAGISPETVVPVLVLDLSPNEVEKVLLTYDPVGEMAEQDDEAVARLAQRVQTKSPDVQGIVDRQTATVPMPILAPTLNLDEDSGKEPPTDKTICPKCGYKWLPKKE